MKYLKINKNTPLLAVFLMATAINFSCKKNDYQNQQFEYADSSKAYIKIIHTSVRWKTLVNAANDSINLYVDSEKINTQPISFVGNSITVNKFTTVFNGMFPYNISPTSSVNNNAYAAVNPGTRLLKLTDTKSNKLYSFTQNLKAGSFYTWFITDSIFASKDSNRIFVQDNWNASQNKPMDGYFNFRFVNAVLNDSAVKSTKTNLIDVFSYARNNTILTKIRPDSITAFVQLGFNISVPDTFYVTRTPDTTGFVPLNKRIVLSKIVLNPQSATVPGYTNNRAITFIYSGDGTLTTGTTARKLNWYFNY